MSIILGMLPTILGLLTSFLPNLVKYLENGQRYRHEIELTKLRMDAAREGLDYKLLTANITALVEEGKSVRSHDTAITYSPWINDLRAMVRPVVTFGFFGLFVVVKIMAATLLYRDGYDAFEVLKAVWDPFTVSIFGAIVGFWFGTRAMGYVNDLFFGGQSTIIRKTSGQ